MHYGAGCIQAAGHIAAVILDREFRSRCTDLVQMQNWRRPHAGVVHVETQVLEFLQIRRRHNAAAVNRDGLQLFAAPDRAESTLCKDAVVAGGDGGNAHQVLACWPNDHALKLMAVFLLQRLLGLVDTQSPQIVCR